MKTVISPAIIVLSAFTVLQSFAQQKPADIARQLDKKRIMLPNGWSLTPVGKSLKLGDLPLNIALSSSKRYLAVTNNGYGKQTIQLIDAIRGKILDNVTIGKSWVGIKFSRDEKNLYVSGGNDDVIWHYAILNHKLIKRDSIFLGKPWPKDKISPAGIETDDAAHRLYVVTKEDNSLYICDTRTMQALKKIPLGSEAYTCLLSSDKKELYISLWGAAKIAVFNTEAGTLADEIPVETHPNDMALSEDGRYLYVANANSNSVSVVDIKQRKTVENISAALYPDAPTGSTTNSVALSADGKTLFIANADNNCLAVFDVSDPGRSRSKGFIPTGWYPACVRVTGRKIFAANGKGFSSMANPEGPNPVNRKQKTVYQKGVTSQSRPVQYIGGLFIGTLSIINMPDKNLLGIYSRAVYKNTPYNKQKETVSSGEPGNPIPEKIGDPSPIKHVFYVIKENRTYDQVLGDIKEGNGDPSLCLFGEKITPNEHAIVKDFVLLDNFYVDGEVSADGHNWTDAAYATDFVEKTWPSNYSGRGGNYDFGGNRKISNPDKGFIWDYCFRAGVSFRNYGEFRDEGHAPKILPEFAKHTCQPYPGWDLSIQDIFREKAWEKDFDSLVAMHTVPGLSIVYLPNDHTSGMSKGAYTPFAHVADNDLALGRLVDHISHSKIWGSSAIFVIEDDAQNGPDHVDAHRSTAYVISPFIKRHTVDHTMYSTSGMVRTIELILGLPPMSQYDAAAMPMWRSFTSRPDLTPYSAKPAGTDINARNEAATETARLSATFDFSKPDAVPDRELNEVVWKAVKGEDAVMPAPRRSAFVKVVKQDNDD